MKPSDLRPGHRIACRLTGFTGALIVMTEPFVDHSGPESAARFGIEYRPDDDRVHVDVEPEDRSSRWDPDGMPLATGARDFQFLKLSPLTYRLYFHPDTDVAVEEW